MERCQKAGFVSPITSKITLTKKKGEKERARRRKGGEGKEEKERRRREIKKCNDCILSFYSGYYGDHGIWPKNIFGRKGPLGDNVFKNPARYMYVC